MKRLATLVATGCLLGPGAAWAQAEAAPPALEVAPAATAAVPTPAPVKYRAPKSSATAKPPTTSVKSSAPDFVAPPVPGPTAAPVAAAVPPAVAPVVAPPAAPAKPPTAAKPGEWLRKDKPPAASPATKDGPSPLRMAGMLLLVATLGGVAYYAKRKKQLPKLGESKAALRVVGSTRVGPKATAVVVEIAGKRILLGVTEQSVSNLAWLDDEANASVESEDTHVTARAARARGIDDVAVAGPSGFLKLLRNAVGTGATPKGAAIDEVARTTRDEVRLTRRVEPTALTEELLEGQVAGLTKRRRDLP